MVKAATPTLTTQDIQEVVNAALENIDYNRGGFLEQFALSVMQAAKSTKGYLATTSPVKQTIVIETKHTGVDACALHQFILGTSHQQFPR